MAQLLKQVISGKGRTELDSTNWKFVKPITQVYEMIDSKNTVYCGDRPREWNDSKLIINKSGDWTIMVYNYVPRPDPSDLRMFMLDGGLSVTGDEEVVLIGQSVDLATVDVSGIRPNCDELARLFTKALGTRTATDAARYLKLKAAVLALYGPK